MHAATPDEVALIPAVSYGMAIIAKNMPVKKGQKIIVAEARFPSNVYAWMTLAAEQGLEVRTVAMPTEPEGRASAGTKLCWRPCRFRRGYRYDRGAMNYLRNRQQYILTAGVALQHSRLGRYVLLTFACSLSGFDKKPGGGLEINMRR